MSLHTHHWIKAATKGLEGHYFDVALGVAIIAYRLEASGDCLVYKGTIDAGGYGVVMTTGKTLGMAHRFTYIATYGPIPDGLEIDHLCRNRACARPDHLEAVTHFENIQRIWRTQTHCVNGHEFNAENTYFYGPTRQRKCRVCARERARRYYHSAQERATA